MGPLKVAATETVAVGVSMGVGNGVDVAVGMTVGVGIGLGGTGASAPHAGIPARSTRNAKADIDRGHRYMREF